LRAHARLPAAAAPLDRASRRRVRPATPQVEELICKFSKKGLTPSQIGVLLRDNHGIAQVSTVTGSKVLRILKGAGA
jgi:small subunit ribosomal protein S13e